MSRQWMTFKANLSVAVFTFADGAEQLADELERIASEVREGSTLSESGNMNHADIGSWEVSDPFEDEPDKPDYQTLKERHGIRTYQRSEYPHRSNTFWVAHIGQSAYEEADTEQAAVEALAARLNLK